jgi:hypothetical protein
VLVIRDLDDGLACRKSPQEDHGALPWIGGLQTSPPRPVDVHAQRNARVVPEVKKQWKTEAYDHSNRLPRLQGSPL